VSFRVGEEHIFLGKEIQEPKDFSEAPPRSSTRKCSESREADEEVALLERHRAELEKFARPCWHGKSCTATRSGRSSRTRRPASPEVSSPGLQSG
jgi:hypothetical protein